MRRFAFIAICGFTVQLLYAMWRVNWLECGVKVEQVWVGKHRKMDGFEKFFTLIGQELAGKIEFVCTDLWRPYLEIIARHCPQALIILDRFDRVAQLNKARDKVCAGEARCMIRAR